MWIYGSLVAVIVILIIVRALLPDIFVSIASPPWRLGTNLTASVGNIFGGLDSKQKVLIQNAALLEQVNILTNENQVLTARSQDLTTLLGGSENTVVGNGNTILAGVLAGPPVSPYDELTIAAGTEEGIKIGAFVYSRGGIPIGTITQSSAHSAHVSLFSTSGRKSSGWIGVNRVPLILKGEGAGSFEAVLTASTTITAGDMVYLPGPGALPIGTVLRTDTDPSSPTPVIHIQPLVNLFSITWVEVSRSASS